MKAPASIFAASPMLVRLLRETVLPLAGFAVAAEAETAVAGIGGGDGDELKAVAESFAAPLIWLSADAINLPGDQIVILPRPAALRSLVSALSALHPEIAAQDLQTIADWVFAPRQRLIWKKNDAVALALTEKEGAILSYLKKAEDRIVERAELLGNVWNYNENVETHTLETHIYRLRQKLEADPGAPRLLLTEAGGYRLAAAPVYS